MLESEKEMWGRKQRAREMAAWEKLSLELLALRMEEGAVGQGVSAAPGS